MPYRKQQFLNDEIYHIILRALDDNLLFKDVDDYYRGIFSIYEFNTDIPVKIRERRRIRAQLKKDDQKEITVLHDPRHKLVEVLSFCFMPNHLHLLLKQIINGGITKFMRKVGTGLGGYFNTKYNRKGHVFQNRFKDVLIRDEDQLKTGFVYIHTNPIALIEPRWKELGVKKPEKTIEFIENYKWSSYQDYLGEKNFPSVTDRDLLSEIMDGVKGCQDSVNDWIRYKGEIREFSDILLE